MPTDTEVWVFKILSAIEIPADAAKKIQERGNEAVTVVCEASLGSYPGIRPKVRTNAVSLLGWMDHPQALETTALLIDDPNPDVSLRAMRAAARQKNTELVDKLGQVLRRSESPPLAAAEALKALLVIGSPAARAYIEDYAAASPRAFPHRGSTVVEGILKTQRK